MESTALMEKLKGGTHADKLICLSQICSLPSMAAASEDLVFAVIGSLQDPHIQTGYMASKATISLLEKIILSEAPVCGIHNICAAFVNCLTSSLDGGHFLCLGHCLDLISLCFRRDCLTPLGIMILSSVLPKWSSLLSILSTGDDNGKTTALHSYLNLWLKIAKRQPSVNAIGFPNNAELQLIPLACSGALSMVSTLKALKIILHSLPSWDQNSERETEKQACWVSLSKSIMEAATVQSLIGIGVGGQPSEHSFGGLCAIYVNSYEEILGTVSIPKECQVSSGNLFQDARLTQHVLLIILKSCSVLSMWCALDGVLSTGISALAEKIPAVLHSEDIPQGLVSMFFEQDDFLIDSMLSCLIIYQELKQNVPSLNFVSLINPHRIFFNFLEKAAFDHHFLLDLLTSPETSFTLYIIKYLKYILHCWQEFCGSLGESSLVAGPGTERKSSRECLHLVEYTDSEESYSSEHSMELAMPCKYSTKVDQVMSVLIRLRLVIERLHDSGLYPYNPCALLSLLARVEDLFEDK